MNAPRDPHHPQPPASPVGSGAFDLDITILVEAPLPADLDAARLDRLARFALHQEGASGRWVVTVALVDDSRLQDLHREFMAIDEPTDVMTFPADEPGASGGDVAVSVDRATEQGPDFGHTPAEEIAFLLLHGLLHLGGWDDPTPEDRAAMLARQTDIIREFEQHDVPNSAG